MKRKAQRDATTKAVAHVLRVAAKGKRQITVRLDPEPYDRFERWCTVVGIPMATAMAKLVCDASEGF